MNYLWVYVLGSTAEILFKKGDIFVDGKFKTWLT